MVLDGMDRRGWLECRVRCKTRLSAICLACINEYTYVATSPRTASQEQVQVEEAAPARLPESSANAWTREWGAFATHLGPAEEPRARAQVQGPRAEGAQHPWARKS